MSVAVKTSSSEIVRNLLSSANVVSAREFFHERADDITAEHIAICSIPAGPFFERGRAEYLCERFGKLGLTDVSIDSEGNCVGFRKGAAERPLILVSAHLDTVFPAGTDFTVRRLGQRLLAPGIGDDGAGLAAVLAIAGALQAAKIETGGSLLFVGTVGEEGEGNLRGVRYLLTQGPWTNRVDAFISFDGPGIERITNRALGSRRYHVELRGPGGHSWGDFGAPNPIHTLGRAISRLASYPVPREPRTTFNIGRIDGGTSVNSIPDRASMEVDLRSADGTELRRLDAYFRRAINEAVEQENQAKRPGDRQLRLDVRLLGERPSGETPASARIVDLAQEATRSLGIQPRLDQASTDSNLPISIGIPALTLGGGGQSGSSHTLDEWFDPAGREHGLMRGLLVILGLVGLNEA
jgi:acetylornithine deacetylase/succinyl-diaminopimelate desuccinylase-like protein